MGLMSAVRSNGQSASDIAYRVLKTDVKLSATFNEAFYAVSIDQLLGIGETQRMICQIAGKTDQQFDRITVSVFYKLEEYVASPGGDLVAARNYRHRFADYVWNTAVTSDRRLAITMDSEGKPLESWRFSDFDHTKDCTGKQ